MPSTESIFGEHATMPASTSGSSAGPGPRATAASLQRPPQRPHDLAGVRGLLPHIVRHARVPTRGRVDRSVARQHDDLGLWRTTANLAEQLWPGRALQPEIDEDHFGLVPELLAESPEVRGLQPLEPLSLDLLPQAAKDVRLLVHQKRPRPARPRRISCVRLVVHRPGDRRTRGAAEGPSPLAYIRNRCWGEE